MISTKHQIGFFSRVILLALTLALLMYWLFVDVHYIRCIYLAIFIAYLIWNIYRNISRQSRDFYTFITALANEEYSIQFSEKNTSKNVKKLYHLYNTTARRFQHVKEQRDMQHLFLKEILNQIDVGIIALDDSNNIVLLNRAFQKNFRCLKPRNTNELRNDLAELLTRIEPGERKMFFPVVEDEKQTLAVHSTSFVLNSKKLTLVYFHNIKTEMDEQELESWQKLFSVLTHEIMNSVTPISSLSSSLNEKLKRDLREKGSAEEKTINLLSEGLEAVTDRSKGLLSFTEAFRKLSKIPQPTLASVDLALMLERIKVLFTDVLESTSIIFTYHISAETATIFVDPQQFEQLFINLVKNAAESIDSQKKGEIKVEATRNVDGKTLIQIVDNGKGMSPEIVEKAFIPFFITKDKGSGIGLSLCRQIVRMHGGTIDIKSKPGEGTSVIIKM